MESPSGTNKVYLLGSKCNEEQSLLVQDNRASRLISFPSFEAAKAAFEYAYKILLSPSFRPSIPPTPEERQYHFEFMRLIALSPVILEIEMDKCRELLLAWVKEGQNLFMTENPYFQQEYWHLQMKPGFLEKFGVLDIAKDIEQTPFIGFDGRMVVRINEINHTEPDQPSSPQKPATQEEIDKILRERGYL